MKKYFWIVIAAIIISASAFAAWNHTQSTNLKMASIHELHHVLIYAEQKGADYAADRLDYLIVKSYTKDDLHKKWGTPNENIADPAADIWQLSDEFQLIMNYDDKEEVRKIEVLKSE